MKKQFLMATSKIRTCGSADFFGPENDET